MSEDGVQPLRARWAPTGATPPGADATPPDAPPRGDAGRAGATPSDATPRPPARSPRRRGPIVAVVLAVVAAGVAGALALGLLDRPGAAPAPQTVVLPSPTPTVAPVGREPRSPFADALPSTVLSYALASFAEETSLLVAGALEGYRLGYSDGGDGVLTVLAGQWPTAEEATAALAAVTSGATPVDEGGPASGDVLVDGAPAGTWTLTRDPAGTTAMTWTNGTALLHAVGPADVLRDVLAAYPL